MDANHDLPPAPTTRHISPAAEDYDEPITLMQVVWPTIWLGLAILLYFGVRALGWPVFDAMSHGH